MKYLIIAIILFCLINAKKSLISFALTLIFLFIYIKKYKINKKLIVLSGLFLGLFMIRNINVSSSYYIGIVTEAKENYYLFSSVKGKFYVYEKNNLFDEGDIIKVKGERVLLEKESIEEKFDFNNYLNNKGYYYRLYVNEKKIIINSLFSRKSLINRIKGKINDDSFSLIKSLFFGEIDRTSDFYYQSESLKFYIITSLGSSYFTLINRKVLKNTNKSFKKAIFWICLTPFIIFNPKRFLWIRLLIFDLINYAYDKRKVKASLLQKVSLSAVVLLFINPYYAFQNSFIVSYAILLSYALINPLINKKKKIIKVGVNFLFMQMILMINTWCSYYEVNLLLPLLSLITPLIYLIDAILTIFLFINYYKGIDYITGVYKNILSIIDDVKINIVLGKLSIYILLLLIIFSLFSIIEFAKNNNKYLKNNLFIVSLILLGEVLPFNKYEQSITFINVGQGDSILIRNKGKSLLIDTGGSKSFDIVTETLIPYFKKNQIMKIDYLLITHEDYDHMGGREELIEKEYILNIIDSKTTFPINFNGIYINNLNLWQNEFLDNNNNKSYVLSFEVNDKKWLLMGDAEEKVEHKLLDYYADLKHDYIKIGHHGSNSSSSLSFLKAVSPKVAIITCGKNNSYGHPHEEVLRRLKSLDVDVRRTDLDGTIKFYF